MQWCESLTVTAFKTAFISRHGCSGTLISHLGAVNILWKNLCYTNIGNKTSVLFTTLAKIYTKNEQQENSVKQAVLGDMTFDSEVKELINVTNFVISNSTVVFYSFFFI